MNVFAVFLKNDHPRTFDSLLEFIQSQPVLLFRNGGYHPISGLRSAMRTYWLDDEGPWMIAGDNAKTLRWFDPFTNQHVNNVFKFIFEAAANHSWIILPWGREEPGEIVAFITQDQTAFERFVEVIPRSKTSSLLPSGVLIDLKQSEPTILLSAYSRVSGENVQGALFTSDEDNPWLWETLKGSVEPIALLVRQTGANACKEKCYDRCEINSVAITPTEERVLLRVENEEMFNKVKSDWNTIGLFVECNDTSRLMEIAKTVPLSQNPLLYSASLLACAEGFYLPKAGRNEMFETLFFRSTLHGIKLKRFLHTAHKVYAIF